MCTVSVIALRAGGFRLVTNRDESPDRPAALPPAWRDLPGSGTRAVWPTDPAGGGTWVGAVAGGLVLTLLNVNDPEAPSPDPGRRTSRGTLIPALLALPDAPSAMEGLAGLELERFEPFRLVAAGPAEAGGVRILERAWDGSRLGAAVEHGAPACFASSGLGDDLVRPRLELFREMLAPDPTDPSAQEAFHAHRWPDRPEISVMMSRPGARTVSVTRVEVVGEGPAVRLMHEPLPPERVAP